VPLYVFESARGKQKERFYPYDACPRQITVKGTIYKKIIVGIATYVPPWMRAPGAAGSSSDASDRQARYLTSDKHRDDMKQVERVQEQDLRTKRSIEALASRAEEVGKQHAAKKRASKVK